MQLKTHTFLAITLFMFLVNSASSLTLSPLTVKEVDSAMNEAVKKRFFPGAQILIGGKDSVIYSNNYGNIDYMSGNKVDSATLYDLASCTKVFATTLSVMNLISNNKLSLDAKIGEVLPKYDTCAFASVSVKELLYHSSGFKPTLPILTTLLSPADSTQCFFSYKKESVHSIPFDLNLYVNNNLVQDTTYMSKEKCKGAVQISKKLFIKPIFKECIDSLINDAYVKENRGRMTYSDINFLFLQRIIEQKAQVTLDNFTDSLYKVIGIDNIGYSPRKWAKVKRIAPTESDQFFRQEVVRGFTHDEMACTLGGVSGNAGLFGNTAALSEICKLFLNQGELCDSVEIFKSSVFKQFITPRRFLNGSTRGLGFDMMGSGHSIYKKEQYGHSGFTGTYFWVDPTREYYVIILSNRVCRTRANKLFSPTFRGELWKTISEGLR